MKEKLFIRNEVYKFYNLSFRGAQTYQSCCFVYRNECRYLGGIFANHPLATESSSRTSS